MNKELVQELIKILSPEITYFIIQAFCAIILFGMIKSLATGLTNYIKLRFSLWGLNTKIIVEGQIGYIRDITFKEVIVSIDEKHEVYIPIENFLKMNKTTYYNGYRGKEK